MIRMGGFRLGHQDPEKHFGASLAYPQSYFLNLSITLTYAYSSPFSTLGLGLWFFRPDGLDHPCFSASLCYAMLLKAITWLLEAVTLC
ncbi:hypothetical protein F5Y19DRAFT_450002 [Xylariaceae sp. FL1651]|nr:hypothetical protein F5Y19DRAFT_450002 [Xylariaceae sp. FL1651]